MNEKRHLLAYVLDQPLSATYLNPPLTPDQQEKYKTLCQRLEGGEPLAYLIGSAEFWSLKFKITPDVLIPRPETELLVEQALALFPSKTRVNVLELGTGSGALSIALKKERPDFVMTGVEKSAAAISVAKENAEFHGADIEWREGDWFGPWIHAPMKPRFDLILSNPPYIPENDPHLLGSIRYEPQMALQSGSNGLKDLLFIIENAPTFLTPEGKLLLEHGYDQAEAVQTLLKKNGYQQIQTFKDVFGNDRVTQGYQGAG